jgi:hypothetical protein
LTDQGSPTLRALAAGLEELDDGTPPHPSGAGTLPATGPFASPMELIFLIGAALLGIGIAWGAISYLTRTRGQDRRAEAATKAEYNEIAREDAEGRDAPKS